MPRHLGQHSGGMIVAQGQLASVVPIEPASMPGRNVVQWDKEDCADMGLIKVDLLGLGMMAVLKDCVELIPRCYGRKIDIAQIPHDDAKVFEGRQEIAYPHPLLEPVLRRTLGVPLSRSNFCGSPW